MHKVRFFIILIVAISYSCYSQGSDTIKQKLPAVDVKNLDGITINTSDISNNGNPIVLCFWKTCCKFPVNMLSVINEVYTDWQKETGVKLIAVSIDDARNTNKVGPFVNGKGWEYEILLDPNSDFERAMNVNTLPHIFILNGKGEIVWQKVSFTEGDEQIIFDILKKIKAGEQIDNSQ